MKHLPALLAILFLASSATYVPEEFAAKKNRVILYGGERALDGDFSPVDDQGVSGFEYSRSLGSLAIEVGNFSSDDESGGSVEIFNMVESFDGSTEEYYVGVRKDFGEPQWRLHPYVGGGLAHMQVELDPPANGLDDDDSVLGVYLHGGFTANIGGAFFLGIDYRLFAGEDASLFGDDVGTGYGQLTGTLGVAF